jgi:hypothetical protein
MSKSSLDLSLEQLRTVMGNAHANFYGIWRHFTFEQAIRLLEARGGKPGIVHYAAVHLNYRALEAIGQWRCTNPQLMDQYRLALAHAIHTPQKFTFRIGEYEHTEATPVHLMMVMREHRRAINGIASLPVLPMLFNTLNRLEHHASFDRSYTPRSMWSLEVRSAIYLWTELHKAQLADPSYEYYCQKVGDPALRVTADAYQMDPTLKAQTRDYHLYGINQILQLFPIDVTRDPLDDRPEDRFSTVTVPSHGFITIFFGTEFAASIARLPPVLLPTVLNYVRGMPWPRPPSVTISYELASPTFNAHERPVQPSPPPPLEAPPDSPGKQLLARMRAAREQRQSHTARVVKEEEKMKEQGHTDGPAMG